MQGAHTGFTHACIREGRGVGRGMERGAEQNVVSCYVYDQREVGVDAPATTAKKQRQSTQGKVEG